MRITKTVRLTGSLLVIAGLFASIWGSPNSAFRLLVIGSTLLIIAGPTLDDDITTIKAWINKKVKKLRY